MRNSTSIGTIKEIAKIINVSERNSNTNKHRCKECGGYCCKSMGCHFSPDDFEEISFEYLKKEIEKGYISIDCLDGNPFEPGDPLYDDDIDRAYYLRTRNIANQFDWILVRAVRPLAPIVDFSYGGQCCLLTDKGCIFEYEKRPKGARELIPYTSIEDGCIVKYSKRQSCKDWYKYNDILTSLAEYFDDKYVELNL